MSATLSSLVKDLYDRNLAARRIAGLSGPTLDVDAVVITAAGSGFTTAPTVTFTGGGGSGASATATILDGAIVDVTITNHGTGYTSAPTVGFSGGGGTGATATAVMAAETLDAIPTVNQAAGELIVEFAVSLVSYTYQLVAGTDAASSPTIIHPSDYDGSTNAKVWKLLGVKATSLELTSPLPMSSGGTGLDNVTTNAIVTGPTGVGSALSYVAAPGSVQAVFSFDGTLPLWVNTTQGQIIFGDSTNGVASSSSLFWDATNKRLGVNYGSPISTFDVNPGNVAPTGGYSTPDALLVRQSASFLFEISVASASKSSRAILQGYKIGGTFAAKTAVASGDYIMSLNAVAWDGAALVGCSDYSIMVDGTVASGKIPTAYLWSSMTAGSASLTEKMRLSNNGALGLGTAGAAAATALFEMKSTALGFLPPRMTTTQKGAISTPAEGLVVYDSTLHKLCVYTGSAWETVTSA
jgi:hypothetical protein